MHSLRIEEKDKQYIVLNDVCEDYATAQILVALKSDQDVVIVSDAGTPLVSDPGFQLVREANTAGIPTVPVPGPSAVPTLASVCPIPLHAYQFFGFLAKRGEKRADQLKRIKTSDTPTVVFESPHRVLQTLSGMLALDMGARNVFLGREMTKRFEEYVYTSLQKLHEELSIRRDIKGELVLVIDSSPQPTSDWSEEQLTQILWSYLKPAQIAAILVELTELSRDEAYASIVEYSKRRTRN